MKLREVLKRSTPLEAWIPYDNPFKFRMSIRIRYVDLEEFRQMMKRCNREVVMPDEDSLTEDELYNKELAKKISGLRGFTLKNVLSLTNFQVPDGVDLEKEIEPDLDSLLFFMDSLYNFQLTVSQSIRNIALFKNMQLENDLKNFETSQESV